MKLVLILVLVFLGLMALRKRAFVSIRRGPMGGRPPRQEEPKKEGEVTIEKKPGPRRNGSDAAGDYVDYEEV